MKLVSGKKKMERQSNALDRLLVAVFKVTPDMESEHDVQAASEKWETRRQAEIATLRQRTGRIHES